METAIICNIIIILCVGAFVFFFADADDFFERFCGFMAGAWVALVFSFWGWVIYVAAHFIGKYW